MLCNTILSDGVISLRDIEFADCGEYYLRWLQDENVNRFLETRWKEQSMETIREFVETTRQSSHSVLFAITLQENGKHIGNIKIGPISPYYHCADISYFIGESDCWGKGYATRAIVLASDYAFQKLQLHRVQAGAFDENVASIRALEKASFVEDGRLREQLISPITGKYVDHVIMGKINPYA